MKFCDATTELLMRAGTLTNRSEGTGDQGQPSGQNSSKTKELRRYCTTDQIRQALISQARCQGQKIRSVTVNQAERPGNQSKGKADRQEREQTGSAKGDPSGNECWKDFHGSEDNLGTE